MQVSNFGHFWPRGQGELTYMWIALYMSIFSIYYYYYLANELQIY